MINFDDLGKKIGETFETVSKKANKTLEIEKLKSLVRGLERENNATIVELGKAVYSDFEDGIEIDEHAADLCEAINARNQEIASVLGKIAKLRGMVGCPTCDKDVNETMAYCPYCGEELPAWEEEVDIEVEIVEEDDEEYEEYEDEEDEDDQEEVEAEEEEAEEAEEAVEEVVEEEVEEAEEVEVEGEEEVEAEEEAQEEAAEEAEEAAE